MPGIEKAKKIQFGLESSKGTAVAASKMWRGKGGWSEPYQWAKPDENVGLLIDANRTYRPKTGIEVQLDSTPATFEQLPILLASGIDDTTSGAANGGTTNGYIYVYDVQAAPGANQNKALTVELGDNQQEYESAYCVTKSFSLTGAPGEAVMMTGTMEAHSIAKSTFTTLTPPTVEEILFQKGKIYSDAIGGTMGATQFANTWLGFTADITTGVTPVWTGDGSLDFSFEKNVGTTMTGTFTVEHDDIGEAVYDRWLLGSPRKVRLEFTGTALTGTGGTHSTKLLRIDLVVLPVSIDPLVTDGNGDNTIVYGWRMVYDSTAALGCRITVVNTISTIF